MFFAQMCPGTTSEEAPQPLPPQREERLDSSDGSGSGSVGSESGSPLKRSLPSPASFFEGETSTPSTTTAPSWDSGTPRQIQVCRYCFEEEEEDFEGSLPAEEGTTTTAATGPSDENVAADSTGNIFVSPCPCRGSSKYVHLRCLIQHFVSQAEWHNFRCPTCAITYTGMPLFKLAMISKDKMVEMHGADSLKVAQSLSYLAQACGQTGQVTLSKEYSEQSLVISEQHFGPGHPATAATLAELASAYGKLGDISKQKELLEQSLEIKEKHFGIGHINTAVTLNNLATVFSELGDLEEEQALLERSLRIKEAHFGKGHVQTTAALVNLAGVYSELGESAKSLELLETSFQIEEQYYGPTHPELAITLNNLALGCGEAGNAARMKALLQRSLAIKEAHFGTEHQELCFTLANLGMACATQGEMEAARSYCRRSLLLCNLDQSVPTRRRQGVVLLRTATVHMALCQEEEATQLTNLARTTLLKALGPQSGLRILGFECSRMSRIWASVHRDDVVQSLLVLKSATISDKGSGRRDTEDSTAGDDGAKQPHAS